MKTMLQPLARGLALFAALSLGAPAMVNAADTASQPAPNRRAADPTLVRTLQDHVWTLQSGVNANGQPIEGLMVPGRAFVLRFDGTRLSVQGGCNNMTGTWRLNPQGQLMAGRLAATMMACEPALMQADTALSAVLAQHLDVSVEASAAGEAPRLNLVSPARQTLVLAGQQTMEARYGEPTRIFLEVAAQRVTCTPALQPATTCLQVRERRFDDKGLRIDPPGEWGAFYSNIDGYTHTPGVRNVLRINRYQRRQVPADASRYVYVLDLVVESETVKQ